MEIKSLTLAGNEGDKMKIESKIGSSTYSEDRIYKFVSDFRNFNNFIPKEKVSNWEAEPDTCSFTIDILGKVGLKIVERVPSKLIKISSETSISQYNFNLWIQIKSSDFKKSHVKVTIEPLLNKVLVQMVKGQLKQFVDSLIDEIEKFDFPD